MHTRLQTTTTTRCYPNPKACASTRNLLRNEDREAELYKRKTQKPSGKLSRRRDRTTKVISSKDFNYPRVLVKSKHQLANARKSGRSSENTVKRKKGAIPKTKGEDLQKAFNDRHKVRVTPSNSKAARTFVLCSAPTKQKVVRLKRRNPKAPSQQLELLRLYPDSAEYIQSNNSSDVFSTAGESLLSTSIPQRHPLYRSAECAIVNAPLPKLISTKHELYTQIVSDCNLHLEHKSLTTIVAAGDTNLRVESTEPPFANVVKRISTYSLMASGGLQVQAALEPTTDNSKATSPTVPADLTKAIEKALSSRSPKDRSSVGHGAPINTGTTQRDTPQLTGTEHSHAQGAIHRTQPENDSLGSLRFDRKDSSIETQMAALMRDKYHSKMPEKQVSTVKEAKRSSRGHPLSEQAGITAKALDTTVEKILKPIRTPRGTNNNSTVQSKSTSRRKSSRTNSNEALAAWKPGGAAKLSSTNLAKSFELKENVPQMSNTRERGTSQQGQTKSLTRRQKTCETEKDSMHLYAKSFNATDTRMMKIYNCLTLANLGRPCKDVTDRGTSTKSKTSSSETDNDSTPHSTVDLLKKPSINSPKSNEAHDVFEILEKLPREPLRSSRNTNHCGNYAFDVKSKDEEQVVMDDGSIASAIKTHESITHSRRQLATGQAESTNCHPQYIETGRIDLKKVREPQLNGSEPIQKLGYKPIKKSMPFVKQGKPKKSINTCTISLNILKQFFYRQGISADLIDRAERDLRRRYGGDGRSIMHVDRLGAFVDKIDKSSETSESHNMRKVGAMQTEEMTSAKNLKDAQATSTLTHVEKPTEASSQAKNLRELCADLQLSLQQEIARDSRKTVNTETQTVKSFMSMQDIGIGCDEKSVTGIRKADACTETVNVRSVSVSTNTEIAPSPDHQSHSSTSVHNDNSSIINENLLAERVFASSSNNTIASTVSSSHSTESLENRRMTLKLYEPAADSETTIERHRRSMGTTMNQGKNFEGLARKSPRSVNKIWGFPARSKIFRRRRDHLYSKRTKRSATDFVCGSKSQSDCEYNTLSPCSSNYDSLSSQETDGFYKPGASLTKTSSGITLPEVKSLMEILLRKMNAASADDTNSLRAITPSTSNSLVLRRASSDSQLIIADKTAQQSFSSFSVVWRACILSVVYGTVCLFVFSCLQFSITCDFGSSHRFS